MPYKKRTKKNYIQRKMQITKQISGPASKTQMTKLVFSEQISLDPGVGLTANSTYNAGGCYDPRTALGGNQPRGFDQWMAFYEHYVVLGSKISVTFQTTGLQPSDGNGIVGILLKANSANEVNNIPQLVELANTRYKAIGPVGGYNSTCTVSSRYSAKRFLGRASPLSDPELKGDLNSNPPRS